MTREDVIGLLAQASARAYQHWPCMEARRGRGYGNFWDHFARALLAELRVARPSSCACFDPAVFVVMQGDAQEHKHCIDLVLELQARINDLESWSGRPPPTLGLRATVDEPEPPVRVELRNDRELGA